MELCISYTEYDQCLGVAEDWVPEENGLLEQLKTQKLAKHGHWNRRIEGLVMTVTEGEIEGQCLHGVTENNLDR